MRWMCGWRMLNLWSRLRSIQKWNKIKWYYFLIVTFSISLRGFCFFQIFTLWIYVQHLGCCSLAAVKWSLLRPLCTCFRSNAAFSKMKCSLLGPNIKYVFTCILAGILYIMLTYHVTCARFLLPSWYIRAFWFLERLLVLILLVARFGQN